MPCLLTALDSKHCTGCGGLTHTWCRATYCKHTPRSRWIIRLRPQPGTITASWSAQHVQWSILCLMAWDRKVGTLQRERLRLLRPLLPLKFDSIQSGKTPSPAQKNGPPHTHNLLPYVKIILVDGYNLHTHVDESSISCGWVINAMWTVIISTRAQFVQLLLSSCFTCLYRTVTLK